MKLSERVATGTACAVASIALAAGFVDVSAQSGHTTSHHAATSVPHDWSHRHLVFSIPTSGHERIRVLNDPRFRHQNLRRHAVSPALANGGVPAGNPFQQTQRTLHRDWGSSLLAGGRVGDGMFPAKFSFDVTATPSCANDFVVFNTNLAGSATKPSIVAYNQLYSTQGFAGGLCNQNGPSVFWSYNTNLAGDTTGTTATSPVLSLDGTKVAYVESRTNANGGSILHILRWKAGQGTVSAPVAPDQTVASWSLCLGTNSCVVNVLFNGAQQDTISPPFYDYSADALYVGDGNGVLHKFAPVFTGTPAEVITGWPITVNSGVALSGPVFDAGSRNIFVGDIGGTLSYVQETSSITGTCAAGTPPCLGSPAQAFGGYIVDPPIVDSGAGTVYAFDGDDVNAGSVYQFNTSLDPASEVVVSVGGTTALSSPVRSGAFDNAYLTSATNTGHLYVCGKDPNFTDRAAIHQITITNGIMSSVSDGELTLASNDYAACSPVTEIYNTATNTEWLFFSVGRSANQTGAGCSTASSRSGCLMSLNLTSLAGSWPPANVSAGYPVPTGNLGYSSTSGIVVDNVANSTTYPQASSIYFTFSQNAVTGAACNGATGVGCAVKLTQAGLQ